MNPFEDPYALLYFLILIGFLFFFITMAIRAFLSGFKEAKKQSEMKHE